jgi:hypothetical protein
VNLFKLVFATLALAALAALSGCSVAQIKANVETKVAQDIAVKDCPTLIPDLQNQIAMATAAVPPDTEGAACAQATIQLCNDLTASAKTTAGGGKCPSLQFYNPNLKADGTPIGCQLGAATGIETLRLAKSTPVTTVKLPAYWLKGCAVVINDINVSAIQFLNQIGLDLAKYNIGGPLGALLP